MNVCEKIILDLLGRALFDADCQIDGALDWEQLYKEARSQTVLPLVYSALTQEERTQIPQELQMKWKNAFFGSVATNEQVLYAQDSLVEFLEKENILCVVLKGKGSASHYPDPSLRVLGDIDVLVKSEKVEEARTLLIANGYEQKSDGDLHIGLEKDNVDVELHKKPLGLSLNEDEKITEDIQVFFEDIIEKRIFVDGVPVPSYLHQAIILLMHKLGHFLNGELGLRQLCDWAVFVQKQVNELFWEELSPLLDTFGIKTFTLVITRACIEYLHLPARVAPWALECEEVLAKDVMELIVESGNFGGKVQNSYGQRLFVDAHSKNRISSFFKVLFSACKAHWQPCAKHPILLPIAPFVLYFQYLKMRKEGKRKKLKLASVYQKAGTRQKLYQELKPFVREEEKGE